MTKTSVNANAGEDLLNLRLLYDQLREFEAGRAVRAHSG